MHKCNWCGKRTKANFKSSVPGRPYHSFCTQRCVMEYEVALKLGHIPRKPQLERMFRKLVRVFD